MDILPQFSAKRIVLHSCIPLHIWTMSTNPSSFPSPTEGYRVWGLALNKEVIGSRRIFGVRQQTEGAKERGKEGRKGPSLFELPILLSVRPSVRSARPPPPPPAPFRTSKRDMSSQRGFNQKGPSAENGFYSDERIWVSASQAPRSALPVPPCPLAMSSSSLEF